MRWHVRARASSCAYALTLSASLGLGTGSVLTQWLIRNSDALAGPRLARQLAGRSALAVRSDAFANVYGVSSVRLL
jgi:hypothetical protein